MVITMPYYSEQWTSTMVKTSPDMTWPSVLIVTGPSEVGEQGHLRWRVTFIASAARSGHHGRWWDPLLPPFAAKAGCASAVLGAGYRIELLSGVHYNAAARRSKVAEVDSPALVLFQSPPFLHYLLRCVASVCFCELDHFFFCQLPLFYLAVFDRLQALI
ncbi:hypothetical protein D9619_008105 [Psilocybe cf. subviscida]|uniref:Uncharacterized protein n=1 Tax=Psilocybe cf. subviscida TaxID=2480587 RepID=A0A8H5AUJ3_9AGAR|nr:hypothetical protein D9619_008105 [Psilocybe cf. subviscida]